jgi:hypothetical protein
MGRFDHMSEVGGSDGAGDLLTRGRERAAEEVKEYAGDEERPLGGFVAVMGVYSAAVLTAGVVIRRRGRKLPERIPVADLALMSVATLKLSRLLAKGSVTSVVRAPFTTFEGVSGPAELKEDVRGTGVRKAVGELLTCPFCLGVWVATGFTFGLVLAPRATRLAASVLTTVMGADVLQFAYCALEQKASK